MAEAVADADDAGFADDTDATGDTIIISRAPCTTGSDLTTDTDADATTAVTVIVVATTGNAGNTGTAITAMITDKHRYY